MTKPTQPQPAPEQIDIAGKRISVDDFVQVLPTPGKKDGFIGKVKGWWITDEGEVTAVDIYGGKNGRASMRSIRPARIKPISPRRQRTLKGPVD